MIDDFFILCRQWRRTKKNHQSFIIGRHVWTRSNGFFSACWRCCELLMSSVVAEVAPPSDRFIKCSLNLVVFDLLYWIASSKWRFHWYILKWSLSALKLNSRSISGIRTFYTQLDYESVRIASKMKSYYKCHNYMRIQ